MKVKGVAIGLGLSAALVIGGGANAQTAGPSRTHRGDMCEGWYNEIVAQSNVEYATYALHALGCHAPYGEWQEGTTRCERIAYNVSKHAYDPVKIGRHGCVQFEDGSWSDE